MPHFDYRALSQGGDMVTGTIVAPTADEVTRRIEYLGLIPIGAVSLRKGEGTRRLWSFEGFSAPRPEDVTIFTQDLALLLKTGAHLNDALELITGDADIGKLRAAISQVLASILSGDTFADALARQPSLFPPVYVALVRIAETSGTLDQALEAIATERVRAEALRRKLLDALRYPAFILLASGVVLVFFLAFVLPQFGAVLRDYQAKLDPVVVTFLALSDVLRDNAEIIAALGGAVLLGSWLALRDARIRARLTGTISRLPGAGRIFGFRRTALFCRNLGILLQSGVTLTGALRILAEMMAATGQAGAWASVVERVRHGSRLSDALAQADALPGVAIRTLRLGEETGQLAMLAGRIAEFYEAKLERSLDRMVGIVGPASIVVISTVVGGLIVSVMTALLSVTQIVQ